jgi:hypothetical protein
MWFYRPEPSLALEILLVGQNHNRSVKLAFNRRAAGRRAPEAAGVEFIERMAGAPTCGFESRQAGNPGNDEGLDSPYAF